MNTENKTKNMGLMFVIAYIAYSSIYIARLNFSVASALFESAGTLNKAQIGIIGSIFSFTYAIGKAPNGYLGDRLSTRRVIVLGLLITGVSNLFIGLLPHFWSIAILWGVNAYGQSMLWGPMLRSFSESCPKAQFRRLLQYLVSAVAAGGILGLLIASACATAWGAAACFLIPGTLALVMAVVIRLFFLDSPGKAVDRHGNIFTALAALMKNVQFRRIIFPAMSHGMIKDNINVWLAIYFIDTFKTDISQTAGFIFLVPAFALIGRFLYPLFYRLLKHDYLVSGTAFILCFAVNMLMFSGKTGIIASVICLGADSALVSVINSHVLSQFPASISDSGSLSFTASIMDLITYGGAGLGSVVFGVLIGRCGYAGMFLIWSIVSLASAVIMLRSHFRFDKKA